MVTLENVMKSLRKKVNAPLRKVKIFTIASYRHFAG